METEQKPVEIVAPEAPTENTVGQHTFFISKSTELDKALVEAKDRGLRVLGWERTKSPINPSKTDSFAHTVKKERFVVKCMAKKE